LRELPEGTIPNVSEPMTDRINIKKPRHNVNLTGIVIRPVYGLFCRTFKE
jgi:hypothetical protein